MSDCYLIVVLFVNPYLIFTLITFQFLLFDSSFSISDLSIIFQRIDAIHLISCILAVIVQMD